MYVWIPSRNEIIETAHSPMSFKPDPFHALTQGLRNSGTKYESFISEAEVIAHLIGLGVDTSSVKRWSV